MVHASQQAPALTLPPLLPMLPCHTASLCEHAESRVQLVPGIEQGCGGHSACSLEKKKAIVQVRRCVLMLIYVAEEMKLATSVRPAARYCSLRRSRTASYEGSAPATTMSSSSHALSYATYRGQHTHSHLQIARCCMAVHVHGCCSTCKQTRWMPIEAPQEEETCVIRS